MLVSVFLSAFCFSTELYNDLKDNEKRERMFYNIYKDYPFYEDLCLINYKNKENINNEKNCVGNRKTETAKKD